MPSGGNAHPGPARIQGRIVVGRVGRAEGPLHLEVDAAERVDQSAEATEVDEHPPIDRQPGDLLHLARRQTPARDRALAACAVAVVIGGGGLGVAPRVGRHLDPEVARHADLRRAPGPEIDRQEHQRVSQIRSLVPLPAIAEHQYVGHLPIGDGPEGGGPQWLGRDDRQEDEAAHQHRQQHQHDRAEEQPDQATASWRARGAWWVSGRGQVGRPSRCPIWSMDGGVPSLVSQSLSRRRPSVASLPHSALCRCNGLGSRANGATRRVRVG